MNPDVDQRNSVALFRRYDSDSDGYLGREDLISYAGRIADQLYGPTTGREATGDRAGLHDAYLDMWNQLAAIADVDRTGRISEQEFTAAVGRRAFDTDPRFRTCILHAIGMLAKALDTNRDGNIRQAEYDRLFAATGLDPDHPSLGFTAVDTDGDGTVSVPELAALAVHLFPLADPAWLQPSPPHRGKVGIALVAHDSRKADLLAWAATQRQVLAAHRLYATGTTGNLLSNQLGIDVSAMRSGPLGGDQQIGAMITNGDIHALVFFWDPLAAHPHGDDVRALIRLAVLFDIMVAPNPTSANAMFCAPILRP